jgi:NADH-quinone oxidoreductase subunit J
MDAVLFFIAAAGAIGGAIGVIASRNPFYSVLYVVIHLVALAVLFLLLSAEFVAATQVVVYAGAVMVLYVFVVAYVGDEERPRGAASPALRAAAFLLCGLVLVLLCVAVLGTDLAGLDTEGPAVDERFGSPLQMGELLLGPFLLSFELAAILLLIAAVGAVVLARRRGEATEADAGRISVADLARAPGTGTLAEAVGDRPGAGTIAEPDAPSAGGGGSDPGDRQRDDRDDPERERGRP